MLGHTSCVRGSRPPLPGGVRTPPPIDNGKLLHCKEYRAAGLWSIGNDISTPRERSEREPLIAARNGHPEGHVGIHPREEGGREPGKQRGSSPIERKG
jgi:hypothetical protein